MLRPQLVVLLQQQCPDLLLYGFCRWVECCLLRCVIGCSWSCKRADQDRCAIQIIETMLNDPGMDVPTEAGMVCFLCYHNYSIGLFDSCSDSFLVKWH